MSSRSVRPITVAINPEGLVDSISRVLEAVAVDEMGWPARDLIANTVSGRIVPSVDFVALDDSGVIGATKVLTERPFPVELAFPEIELIIDEQERRGKVVEVALTGVKKERRGDLSVMLSIYRALYHWSVGNDISAWFSVQEKQITRLYQRIGMPFEELSAGRFYWGGISYPCLLSLAKAEAEMQRRNPTLWSFMQEVPNHEVT